MNGAVLSECLRGLREPPPGAEFERRLEQALWREAQALRAERRRSRAERADRDRALEPPGREIARERSGSDHAERGLERAREAQQRK